jgi:S-adenosylmethionine:tRNA ribosyltransferase-isomerase
MKVRFAEDFEAEVLLKEKEGTVLMQFEDDDAVVRAKANRYGFVPTPPYVSDSSLKGQELEDRYQTVYAVNEGSVAAPTAGFHFTPKIIEELKRKGVDFAEVTLHVGLGTFLPVKTDTLEDHVMHDEWVEISDKNARLINEAKHQQRRVIAIGTTSVRALEGVAARFGEVKPYSGDINIFITPGFKFKVIDALVTNFHLPKSTLLMLVSAFMGDKDFTLQCYEEAKKNGYRFYSFGDAMFIK